MEKKQREGECREVGYSTDVQTLSRQANHRGSSAEMAGRKEKIPDASASSQTRKEKQDSSFHSPSGILRKIPAVFFLCILAWAYQAIQPPSPNICGSPNGPPVTAPRIMLKDGRHLAYKEHGVPKDKAKDKIVYVHGFDSCRHDALPLSPEVAEELGVYLVSFDRDGYGESDPNPKRTVKSTALDIEELADQLDLGSKFYVIGFSMGGQIVWSCLKCIPHRLAGATLISPVVNYWWPGIPTNLSSEAYKQRLVQDQWALRVVHYFPWLTYWWNTQKWFPSSSVIPHSPDNLSPQDKVLFPKFEAREHYKIRQQGEFESVHRDTMVGFGTWEFDPLDLENLFPNNEGTVHLWHGEQDWLVQVSLQRYICSRLPWVQYHELSGAGHMFLLADGMTDTMVKVLVLGRQ